MFKKHVDVKALQRLSGADKKKLRRTAKERFPQASDADLDAILPPKVEVTVAKYPNRVLVYGIEGEFPMLFDVDGRGHELFPTVYALWKVPDLLPAFTLKGGEVSRFILGGADLMFPGISIPPEGLPSFQAGQPWSVKVPGNPAPIAVGATTISSNEALQAGLRGKALRIVHYFKDSLWDSADGRYVPNEGFYDDIVIEDPNYASLSQPSGSSEDHAEGIHDSTIESEEAAVDVSESHTTDHPIHAEAIEDLTAGVNEVKLSEDRATEEPTEEREHQNMSTEEIDSLLDKCLLQALHMSIKDKDLPIPGSTLWSNHVLPCRPPGVTLDIKKSSHKKLSKWLQSKSAAGLISAKEDKYKKEVMLLGINRGHPDYMAFKPEKKVQEPVEQRENVVAEGSSTKQLEVAEIYKPSSHVNPIFMAVGADTGKYYSASEASDVAFRYVEKEILVKPTDKAKVILDAALCDALYKGAIKKGSAYPTEIHKRDLGSTFLNRMQIHHRVARENEVVIRKGAIRTIQIMTERRQGNKKMTRLSGLECFLMDADSLASELQKKFACSTTTAELPGKKGQHEVLVQGGVIDDLAKHLVDHYGVPKRFIEVLDKTKR
ncbi:eukaryotic translation initiation factor 2D [Oryza brachyantha]|uniref:SUI1 domain-containing protein n=1 Tax=Oryza brachyantha TaxID=4533 RepID=J3LDV3_ORYBR|nr:eukaryotic translation initiation factor 2D [Oryza brachyantha]